MRVVRSHRARRCAGTACALAIIWSAVHADAQVIGDPSLLLADPSSLSDPLGLTLLPSRTSDIYYATVDDRKFNLHSYVTHYDDQFWAVWSSGFVNEDAAGQIVRYATSQDGHTWSEPQTLAQAPSDPSRYIARGVYVQDDTLYALGALYDGSGPGEAWRNLALKRFRWEDDDWVDEGVYLDNALNNYPPRLIGDRLVMSVRDSTTRMHTAITDSGGENWTVTPLPGARAARMSEPSWYVDPQGVVHMTFRDQGGSHFLHQSLSTDGGGTWTAPVQTNYPDATSKNFTGQLSNGWYYLINNPNPAKRDPLAISFSTDGWTFGTPLALQKGAPPLRFPGAAKGSGTLQYPHAIEHDGSLWVIHSLNKEDIRISEFLLSDIERYVNNWPDIPELELRVDHLSGHVELYDASGGTAINGYSILSPSSGLNAEHWSSLASRGYTGWGEIDGELTDFEGLAEQTFSGDLQLAAGETISLGTPFVSDAIAPLGQALPAGDLVFRYRDEEGNVLTGNVRYVSAANNLVLVVDRETGQASLENQSVHEVAINGYSVNSSSGALSESGWISLDDQGISGWDEANPAADLLSELNLMEELVLVQGDSVDLGALFTVGGAEDLGLTFRLTGGGVMEGVVDFFGIVDITPGDFNGDGLLNELDYTLLRDHFGTQATFAQGDVDGDGDVDLNDFDQFAALYQSANAVTILLPEPSCLTMLFIAGGMIRLRSKRQGMNTYMEMR